MVLLHAYHSGLGHDMGRVEVGMLTVFGETSMWSAFLAANCDRAVLSHLGELCAPIWAYCSQRCIFRKLGGESGRRGHYLGGNVVLPKIG